MPKDKISNFILIIGVLTLISFGLFFESAEGQNSQDVARREAELRAELEATEREIAIWQAELQEKKQESASFSRDIQILTARINEAQAKVRAGQIAIEKLSQEIDSKVQNIEELDSKMDRTRESLSQLIRRTDEVNSFSIVEILLSNENLSEFLIDLDTFDSINKAVHSSFKEIRNVQYQLDTEKEELKVRVNREADVKAQNEAERRRIQADEQEKQKLLAASKSEEKTYEQIIAEREKKAAQIRAALFALRDIAPIPFGEALDLANRVFQKTGVRPAFLLGILTQESNLGENVGQCLIKNTTNGDGVGKNTGRFFSGIMHPSRDIPPFLDIANRLGFDPLNQPISCPQPGGYGGAMGPSQFIPSTWAMYEHRVTAALGTQVANPWDPEDAFMASGLFLADLGAGGGGYSAEREAAARYYAGSGWQTRGLGYADSVLGHAQRIQETMIDPLSF